MTTLAASPSSRRIVPPEEALVEVLRFARALVPLAAVALLGPTGVARPPVLEAADPPWDPPACRAAVAARPSSAGVAWFRMDAVLDAAGTLTGQRLTVGVVGGTRQAARPAARSRSPRVPSRASCWSAMTTARGPACAPSIRPAAAHRRSRWRRRSSAAPSSTRTSARRSSTGSTGRRARTSACGGARPAAERRSGSCPASRRTPATGGRSRRTSGGRSDGRLAVASCGEVACRTRIVDTATGRVVSTSGHRTGRSASRSRA